MNGFEARLSLLVPNYHTLLSFQLLILIYIKRVPQEDDCFDWTPLTGEVKESPKSAFTHSMKALGPLETCHSYY